MTDQIQDQICIYIYTRFTHFNLQPKSRTKVQEQNFPVKELRGEPWSKHTCRVSPLKPHRSKPLRRTTVKRYKRSLETRTRLQTLDTRHLFMSKTLSHLFKKNKKTRTSLVNKYKCMNVKLSSVVINRMLHIKTTQRELFLHDIMKHLLQWRALVSQYSAHLTNTSSVPWDGI